MNCHIRTWPIACLLKPKPSYYTIIKLYNRLGSFWSIKWMKVLFDHFTTKTSVYLHIFFSFNYIFLIIQIISRIPLRLCLLCIIYNKTPWSCKATKASKRSYWSCIFIDSFSVCFNLNFFENFYVLITVIHHCKESEMMIIFFNIQVMCKSN